MKYNYSYESLDEAIGKEANKKFINLQKELGEKIAYRRLAALCLMYPNSTYIQQVCMFLALSDCITCVDEE